MEPEITISAVDKTKAAFDAVSRRFEGITKSANALQAPLLKAQAAIAAIGAVSVAINIKGAIDAADQLDELSQRVGVSAETLSTLRFAAEQSGVELEALGTGIKKLSVNMADAQRGTGEALDAFKALNISVEETPGALKLTDQVLLELAEKFSRFEDGANKTALAIKLFGKAGAELIPFLNQGRAGIERLREEAERLGLKIGTTTAAQAGQFNDNLDALGKSATQLGRNIANELLPSLVQITDQMRLAAEKGGLWAAALAGVREAFAQIFFSQSTVAGYGASVDSLNKAITEQLALIDRLENQAGRRGTRLGDADTRARALEAARAELERLKQESIKQQTLAQFDTPGGLNAGVTKPTAPALPDEAKAKAELAEQERLRKMNSAEWVKFIDEQIEREKELALIEHKRATDLERADEEVRKTLRDGWVAYAEAVQQASDEEAAAIARMAEEANKAKTAGQEFAVIMTSAFEDAVIEGEKLSDLLKALEKDILRLVTRELVTKPLAGFIGSAVDSKGGAGGFLSSIFDSFIKFLKPNAAGGPVYPGQGYLVGERGPEFFTPSQNGTIVPNHALRGMGATYNINVAVPPGTPRETALQMAARTAGMLQYAQGYNG